MYIYIYGVLPERKDRNCTFYALVYGCCGSSTRCTISTSCDDVLTPDDPFNVLNINVMLNMIWN